MSHKDRTGSLSVVGLSVGAALLFQYGHFLEHAIQAAAWIGGYRHAPYMTGLGHALVQWFGEGAAPAADAARQKRLGVELLHLFGNAVFCYGVFGFWRATRHRLMRAALWIEGAHLAEHALLTVTVVVWDQAVGFSTLFGLPLAEGTAVALRVWIHFALNAVPTLLVTLVLGELLRRRRDAAPPVTPRLIELRLGIATVPRRPGPEPLVPA